MASPHVAGAAALLASGANDPTSKADVDAIMDTIINAGNFGWTDDSSDGVQEPLLDVSTFIPATVSGSGGAPVNAAPTVSISSPDDGLTFGSGVTIDFAGSASDTEDVNLSGADLSWTSSLDGPIGIGDSFSKVLSDGNHTITASVTDSDDASGSDSVSVTVGAAPTEATTVHVEDPIGCSFYGGKSSDKHLDIEVTVLDDLLNLVAGATVSVNITRNDGPFWTPTATTAADGTVVFAIKNAAAGDYVTTVTNVDAAPLTWDNNQPLGNICNKL